MEPSKQPLSKLLTIEGTHESYRIPKYQRPYSWTPEDWQQLLDDIQDDSNDVEGHFMGSVICVDASSGRPGEPRVFELIDGQQRLTTLSCLLIAIWSKFNEVLINALAADSESAMDEDDLSDLKATMDDVRRKILRERRYHIDEPLPPIPTGAAEVANLFYIARKKRTDYFCRLLPSTQDANRDDYMFGLTSFGLLSDVNVLKPRNWGNRRIAKCLRYMFDQLPNDVLALKALVRRINALVFIHIKVNSQSDAFRLFEAINNRGVPLSALDIIKNAMLAALEREAAGSIDEAFEMWSSMTEQLGSDTSVHESYLRHFYNAFQIEPGRSVARANRATKSTIIDIFETLIKTDAKGLLTDLANRAKYYGAIIQPENAEISEQRRARLLNLSHIEAKPSYQFLLYLLDREALGQCKPAETNKVIDLIASYFVRRNLTGIPATNRLDAVFIDLVARCEKALLSGSPSLTFDFVRTAILDTPRGDSPATDDQMKDALNDYIYLNNPGIARYLLCHYVESRATDEDCVDLWRRTDKGRYVWTIEHVLPQGEPLKKGWIEMLANGDADVAADIQEEHKDLLGNLTLSAYNSNLSDAAFPQKQKKSKVALAGETAYIGYMNGMVLNTLQYKIGTTKLSLATTTIWNEKHILARGKVLSAAIMKAFPL